MLTIVHTHPSSHLETNPSRGLHQSAAVCRSICVACSRVRQYLKKNIWSSLEASLGDAPRGAPSPDHPMGFHIGCTQPSRGPGRSPAKLLVPGQPCHATLLPPKPEQVSLNQRNIAQSFSSHSSAGIRYSSLCVNFGTTLLGPQREATKESSREAHKDSSDSSPCILLPCIRASLHFPASPTHQW